MPENRLQPVRPDTRPSASNPMVMFDPSMMPISPTSSICHSALLHLLKKKYPTINNVYANYQPVFLIDQMIATCEFEGIPYQMTPELIDRAWANMFVKDEKIVK